MKRKWKIALLSIGLVFIISIGTFLPIFLIKRYKYWIPDVVTNPDRWELVFEDNFLGTELNTSFWSKNYHDGFPNGGHTHNHRGYMTEENVNVSDGILIIRAENETHPDAPPAEYTYNQWMEYNFTTGAITSYGKMQFKYGYIEASMRMPKSKGFWPAFWTLPGEGGWPPEIDIHEFLSSYEQRISGAYHHGTGENLHSFGIFHNTGIDLSDGFHRYGLEWAPDHLSWYFDGKQMGRYFSNREAIAELGPQYILINLAIGGWEDDPDSTTIWPAFYKTDYVKIWQLLPEFASLGQEISFNYI
ncbi:MAG: glycoside hydrolase family 16 protein [Promethearchaeota archaeon]|nr:MAG: glycoside hydrolase family 16 protein [Candidatus Lokiarchaeota archaeon]